MISYSRLRVCMEPLICTQLMSVYSNSKRRGVYILRYITLKRRRGLYSAIVYCSFFPLFLIENGSLPVSFERIFVLFTISDCCQYLFLARIGIVNKPILYRRAKQEKASSYRKLGNSSQVVSAFQFVQIFISISQNR